MRSGVLVRGIHVDLFIITTNMSLAVLLQAAEYIERRERGKETGFGTDIGSFSSLVEEKTLDIDFNVWHVPLGPLNTLTQPSQP